MIHPIDQTLEIYRLQGETWGLVRTFCADDKAHAEPFDAVELDLAMLWGTDLEAQQIDKADTPAAP